MGNKENWEHMKNREIGKIRMVGKIKKDSKNTENTEDMENREKENGFKLVIKRKYVNKLGLRCTKLKLS